LGSRVRTQEKEPDFSSIVALSGISLLGLVTLLAAGSNRNAAMGAHRR